MQAQFDYERESSSELYKQFVNDNIDGTCHYSFHSQIELYFVDEGQIEALINNQRMVLKKNQMAVALSYDAHLFRSIGSSKSSLLAIPPSMCAEFQAAVQGKQVKNPFICDTSTVQTLKKYALSIHSNSCNPIKLRGYLYMILGIVLDNIFLENTPKFIDATLSSQLLIYLGQNFKTDLTLKSLSTKFGYSESYLSRYFRKCFGIGIAQYVNILRLRNALLLIKENTHTHTYCALESGFNSVRTFYRTFQKEFHCSPKDYITGIPNSA